MMDAVFRIENGRAMATPHAAGPWSPTMQHGSAPAGLATWAAEAVPTPVPMQVARVTVDLMRPVPLAPLDIETEVLRQGRKIQLCEVRLRADKAVVVRATVLKIKVDESLSLPPDLVNPAMELPGPDQSSTDPGSYSSSPFADGISMRTAYGRFGAPGRAAIWYRADRPLIAGCSMSQAMRAVIASDFCNGTSAALDFREWTFLNADLTVSLARQPVGDWVLLEADSWIGPDGTGLAMAKLGDRHGYFGRAVQSLVIEPR